MFYYLFCFVIVISSVSTISTRVVRTSKNESRIAGGQEGHDSDFYKGEGFEHQVQINIFRYRRFCSGAVVNKRNIVTACHCVYDVKPEDLEVRVGSRTRGKGSVIPIEAIHCHPEYDRFVNNYDVAYLSTSESIQMEENVHEVYLNWNDGAVDQITIGGWGADGNGIELRDELWYTRLDVISNAVCQTYYPEIPITKHMICAMSRDHSEGACKGDGGGPATAVLPRNGQASIYTSRLYGISSFTRFCGPGMGPSVFTFVESKEIYEFILNGTDYFDHAYAEYYWDY